MHAGLPGPLEKVLLVIRLRLGCAREPVGSVGFRVMWTRCSLTLAGSPSHLSVGEQPDVTHDPYEFLQSPEPTASVKN